MGKIGATTLSVQLGVLRDTFEELPRTKVGAGGTAATAKNQPLSSKDHPHSMRDRAVEDHALDADRRSVADGDRIDVAQTVRS